MEEIEKREFKVQVRSAEDLDSRTIEGVAISFNTESRDLGGFVEVIKPEAFTNEDIKRFDIRLIAYHNSIYMPLARSNKGNGSLKIEVKEDGVHFSADMKTTAIGEEVLQSVRNQDITAMSFAFIAESQQWSKRSEGNYLRTITKFKNVKEFSLVDEPAYEATSISARAFDEFKESEIRENADLEKAKADELAKQKADEDKKYWGKYEDLITKYKNLN